VAQNLGAALAPPSAASSGSNAKAPGSAGGYLLPMISECFCFDPDQSAIRDFCSGGIGCRRIL
jgi:hypothetical protein